jgi:hypothetical protein
MGFFTGRERPKPEAESLDLRALAAADNPARDRQIAESITGIGVEEFPDNEHNTWSVLKTLHVGHRSYVLAEPEPKDVGYDQFVFVFQFDQHDSGRVTLATYCSGGDRFYLLSTGPGCHEEFQKVLVWPV